MESHTVEQHSYIKIAVLHCTNIQKCHTELPDAVGDGTTPYQLQCNESIDTRKLRVSTADTQSSGHSMTIQMSVVITSKCIDKDRHWNMKELAESTSICGPTTGVHKFSANVGATLKF
jgi:hypothetical protein